MTESTRPSALSADAAPETLPLVGWARLGVATATMVLAVAALHALCLHFYPKAELDPWNLSDFYPLSVYKFRLPRPYQLAIAAATWALFRGVWARACVRRLPLGHALAAGLALLVLGNLLHGWRYGIDYPTAASGTGSFEYYHDAILLEGPLWFLERFNAIQFELLEHARTHPPGPVLLYYFLHHALADPGLISIAIGALSLGIALPYLRRLMQLVLGDEPPGALLLYAVLPAVFVYGIAVVDAVVASLFLAALVELLDEEKPGSALRAALWLALSGFFTFAALFLLPVFFGLGLVRRKGVRRAALVTLGAALLLAALGPLSGFDWSEAFLRASAIENEKGFLLLANPRGYLWYRLGAVAEILLFFTPFLCLLAVRGLGALRREHPSGWVLAWLGPLTLLCMLLAGMLKIGEAARVCLFVLPYLLLPVWAAWQRLDEPSRVRLGHLVFAWAVSLQLFGFYVW